MSVPDFMNLIERLRISAADGSQKVQGSAKDLNEFFGASGQPETEYLFLGLYGALMATTLDEIEVDMATLDGDLLDDTRVCVEVTPVRMKISRVAPGQEGSNDE